MTTDVRQIATVWRKGNVTLAAINGQKPLHVRRDHFLAVLDAAKAGPASPGKAAILADASTVVLEASVVGVAAATLVGLCELVLAAPAPEPSPPATPKPSPPAPAPEPSKS